MNFDIFLYALKAYFYLPITFIRRVVFGKDPHLKSYFWNKWGYVNKQASPAKPLIWIHLCSGGEIIQGLSLIKKIRKNYPSTKIFISTDSADVYHFAKNLKILDDVFYAPWDLKGPVRRALKRMNPKILMAIEFTRQPVLFKEAQRLKIKTILLSGRLAATADQDRTLSRALNLNYHFTFDVIGAKSEEDKKEFFKRGIPLNKIDITGDLKFDSGHIQMTQEERAEWMKKLRITENEKIFFATSINLGDKEILLQAYARAKPHVPRLKLWIAPRYSDYLPEIEDCARAYGIRTTRLSCIPLLGPEEWDLTLIDAFGILRPLCMLSHFIAIGGMDYSHMKETGLKEGHSPIEALLSEKPILFGPHMYRWTSYTHYLKSIWPGCEVRNADELAQSIIRLSRDEALVLRLQKAAKKLTTLEKDPIQENFLLFQKTFEHT